MAEPSIKDKTPQNNTKRWKIIVLGLVVHIFLLSAVFDVYFSSPLDHGMTPIRSTEEPPARRLVLFIADGLRAEAIFGEDNKDRAPFLSSVLRNNGSWGVAHTRVPTESRPGHVALLGGIYEDPSAILKGWKANPVYFDSVINESTNAWCWGSPDIVDIFNKDRLSHIHLSSYNSEIEDFGKKDTGLLDTWVFDRVQNFLFHIAECKTDCDEYFKNGNLFFLHLLGIDTAGHGYKPRSEEYVQNIKLVDANIEQIYYKVEETFDDKKTAYIFTSDHGMTDWGSHGAGSLHETEVPFIAWGAGIKRNKNRQDLKQIDVAPLMSSLIGINIPTNSLGILPLEYLETSMKNLARMHIGNALQLLETFNVKRKRIEKNALVVVRYKNISDRFLNDKVEKLWMLYNHQYYDVATEESKQFMLQLIDGLEYYHNYYKYPILISVSLGFVAWIFLLVASIVDKYELRTNRRYLEIFIICNMISATVCYKQQFPFTFYLYFSFPLLTTYLLFLEFDKLTDIFKAFTTHPKSSAINILCYSIGIELLVYGFFNRGSFTLLIILMGFLTFLFSSWNYHTRKRDKLTWMILCLILAVFPSLPVMKTTFNTPLFIIGCLVWILLFYEMYFNVVKYYDKIEKVYIQYRIMHIQLLCFILAAIYVLTLENGIISNDSPIKYLSWFLSVVPISLIPLASKFIVIRLISTFFAFAPFYLLVSPNYEVLFSAVYVAVLCNWMLTECKTFLEINTIIYYVNFDTYKSKQNFDSGMLQRSFLFMIFIFVGFFGTGNIASLNSFDPMWVRAFLTVFSPFKMMGLILLKIMVPFIFACCVFRAINFLRRENVLSMFCAILVFSDLMVLQFMYLITNVGSWLDIGTSLSHFIIMEGFVTILLVLYGAAHLVTTLSYF